MFRQKAIFIGILLAGCLSITGIGHAATINATSCSQSAVQAAVNLASSGDTVVIPSGSRTWSSGVNIPDSKKITLQGAGYNNTIITISGTAIDMNESGSRITGFSFIQLDNSTIDVGGTGWRIDHCRFHHNSAHSSIRANARNRDINPSGLIDNNVFHNGRIVVNGFYTFAQNCEAWAEDLALGSDNAVYIENNTITRSEPENKNIADANRSGRYVLRYNDISNTYIEAHSLQDDRERATRKWEVYNNTFSNTGSMWTPMLIRGVTGVIFGNKVNGAWTAHRVTFDNSRTNHDKGDAGKCDGTSPWDGNEGTGNEAGWPCRDQIGRSSDAWLWTTENPYPPQTSMPAYLWLNRNGVNILNVSAHNDTDNHIKNNRDYYNETEGFDGTSGTGYGTLANRPDTCTTGVGYWAIDQGSWNKTLGGEQGVLYKCISTNTWEKYYEPYEYPHPLTKETVIPAPTGLEKVNIDTFSGGSVWAKSTEKTYTYYLTSKKYDGKSIKWVKEDGTRLVETSSIDLCESTIGSYFLNIDGTLYVHCTDGADPDMHTIEVIIIIS